MAKLKSASTRPQLPRLFAIALVLALLYFARDVLAPIAMAAMLTFALAPLVVRLERLRLPRPAAVLVVVVAAGTIIIGLGWLVQQQLYDLVANLPGYRTNILAKLEALRTSDDGVIARASEALEKIGAEIAKPAADPSAPLEADVPAPAGPIPVTVIDPPTTAWAQARSVLFPLFKPLAMTGLVLVFTVFMLLKREDVRNRFIRLIGRRDLHQTTKALDEAAHKVSRFIVIQLVVNATCGVCVGIGLFLLDVPNPALWGLVVAVSRFVPYVGFWIAACLPLAVSFAVSPDWTQPLLTLGLFVVVEVLVGSVVEPLVHSSGTGVSALAILVAAVVWTWLWGGIGLLLSIPITVCLVVLGEHVPSLRFLSVLMGSEPPLAPETSFYQRILAGDTEEAADIVQAFAKDKSPVEVFDSLVIPALRMAEADRHNELLDEDRERLIDDALAAVIEEVGDDEPSPGEAERPPRSGLVLCIPARDYADELAATMLAKLLLREGIQARALSAESFSGELMTSVAEIAPSVVCLSAVPPGGGIYVRVLAKRLRATFPKIPLVIGIWAFQGDVQAIRQKLGPTGDRVATTLAEAVGMVRSSLVVAAG